MRWVWLLLAVIAVVLGITIATTGNPLLWLLVALFGVSCWALGVLMERYGPDGSYDS